MTLLFTIFLASAPSDQALVYYNARMALREGRSAEVLQLWLLRNTLENQTRSVSGRDADFLSLNWIATGNLGFCQDGLEEDVVGLWPIALHNYVVKNLNRSKPPSRMNPFKAFSLGRQQRFVSLQDILDGDELETVKFSRTKCRRGKQAFSEAGGSWFANLKDKKNAILLLRYLLNTALETLDESVVGRSVVEARILDLDFKAVDEAEKIARREARANKREAKQKGVILGGGVKPDIDKTLKRLIRLTSDWTAQDWLRLEKNRRLFLFERVVNSNQDFPSDLTLELIDELARRGDGDELDKWIAWLPEGQRNLVWEGARGRRLLALDGDTGFRERGVISINRGVAQLEAGDLGDALRSFAYAIHYAADSRASEELRSLSLRWMSYLATRFTITRDLLNMLTTLVPRTDLAKVLDDLIWNAALRADKESYDLALAFYQGRGALRRRAQKLSPLATGRVGVFITSTREGLKESPYATMRFLKNLFERLSVQDADIRARYQNTLVMLQELLLPLGPESGGRGSLARSAETLVQKADALIDALAQFSEDERNAARGLGTSAEVFAGNIRLAPSDPLPWPFVIPRTRAPSVFTPLVATPEEWRHDDLLIFGWRLGQ